MCEFECEFVCVSVFGVCVWLGRVVSALRFVLNAFGPTGRSPPGPPPGAGGGVKQLEVLYPLCVV